jgi:hypothetical protein
MNKFKAGDKVKRIGKPFGSVKVGDIETVETVRGNGSIELVDHFYVYDPKYFELVQDEKESTSAWLKENKWFIRTGSPEKSVQTQKWLFEHGIDWAGHPKDSFDIYGTQHEMLTNTRCGQATDTIMWSVDNDRTAFIAQEITLEFETVVKSVKLPEAPKPTEQESQQKLRIIELEGIINDAKNKIEELKLIK